MLSTFIKSDGGTCDHLCAGFHSILFIRETGQRPAGMDPAVEITMPDYVM